MITIAIFRGFGEYQVNVIKPFEEGIAAHKEHRYEVAWECFTAHSHLGLSLAKYWMGYYFYNGHNVDKNRSEALKWYKMAADEGITDAQLRYALGLVEINGESKIDEILHYMTLAVEAGNESAMFHLGDIYYHGKLGMKKNKEKRNELIKLAASKKQFNAIRFLDSNIR